MANDEHSEAKLTLSLLSGKNLMLVRVDLSDGSSVTMAVNRQHARELGAFIDDWLAQPATPKPVVDPEDYPADHPEHADNIGKTA